ncbi:MAG: hypothetical protein IPL86_09830 [Flavobacteriales bacterium]|nr:hypothetical protein [Flavobacteriales bacterium]
MKKCLLLLACFVFGPLVKAQMLLVEASAERPTALTFNPDFISRNGIKSVKGQDWTKRDGRPMVARNRYYLYRFGERGLMEYANNSFGSPGSGVDTASVMYTNGSDGKLLEELHNDPNGWYAIRNEYDIGGKPVRAMHVRIENLSSDRYRLEPGTNTVVSDETFEYTAINDTSWRKTFLNDRGRPYREETYKYDRLGYLRVVEDRNLITQRMGQTTFIYDPNGRLGERTDVSDLGNPHPDTWRWTYDKAGNPLTRDVLRDGRPVRHSEYVYAEGTLFLKAIITKDMETGLIEIVRYDTFR